jgi:hypothetical protein
LLRAAAQMQGMAVAEARVMSNTLRVVLLMVVSVGLSACALDEEAGAGPDGGVDLTGDGGASGEPTDNRPQISPCVFGTGDTSRLRPQSSRCGTRVN